MEVIDESACAVRKGLRPRGFPPSLIALQETAGRLGARHVRFDPEILTNVYQSMGLKEWEEHLRKKPRGAPLVGAYKMDRLVMSHISFLTAAVGVPSP
jgi:hypothetical protein